MAVLKVVSAKERFQRAVILCLEASVYPGPLRVLRALRPNTARHSLNGQEIKWREEVLLDRGWTRHPEARPAAWRHGKGYPRFGWIKP